MIHVWWTCLHFHRAQLQTHHGSWQTSAAKGEGGAVSHRRCLGAQVCYTSGSGPCIHHSCQVVLPPGGWVGSPFPPTQHEEYLLLDNLVHHFQRGLQVAVAMVTGLCHTGTDVHTEHVEVIQETTRGQGRVGATHHTAHSLHTLPAPLA